MKLYFDSSVLIASGWPNVSAELERVLKLCPPLKIPLFIPDAVELELEEHWLRSFDEKVRQIESRLQAFTDHIASVVTAGATIGMPARERALQEYRQKVQEFKQHWGINGVPFTARPIEELVRMAALRHPPFKERDEGFRDAVILLSIVDHLRQKPEEIGAFVSLDAIFKREGVTELAKAAGTQVEIYGSLNEVFDRLKGLVDAAVTVLWQADQNRALAALENVLPEIGRFVPENLEVEESQLGLFYGAARALSRIEVVRVKNIRTPLPVGRRPDEPVAISFDVDVKLHVVVERPPLPPPRVLKVGEELSPLAGLSLAAALGGPTRTEEVVERVAEIEALATVVDNEYRKVRLSSVRLQQQNPFVGLRRLLG